ncbi:hypothetical protein [Wolbachia endosymbiont of Trichogramma pretiosum]|uniref:hypothetical protein n=1 Tax=Wolbachia endosymbiont of Trichogramma pretiosum TaxID=125593 RepID=UPI00083938B9|nr:hypothetical protein [Wolbachia endosymbiont of Trichogramma pretiosum]OCA05780.1 hypothetical protein wTpre_99 [Wolbachia endosymbiont of Trichogramma pretiosum]
MCAIPYSKPESRIFFEQNIVQLAFIRELRDMAQSYDVNFIENGGKHLAREKRSIIKGLATMMFLGVKIFLFKKKKVRLMVFLHYLYIYLPKNSHFAWIFDII